MDEVIVRIVIERRVTDVGEFVDSFTAVDPLGGGPLRQSEVLELLRFGEAMNAARR